jgi:hypothetical protein
MSARDIPRHEWPAVLAEFSREHRAWLATVERIDSIGSRHVAAVERPLGSVTAEITARRIVAIDIQFQADSHGSDVIHVETPTHLRMNHSDTGTARGLEIENQRGECTRILFRAIPLPETLDGVAPGEI